MRPIPHQACHPSLATATLVDPTSSPAAVLRAALQSRAILRVGGVHDGISALVAERCGMNALWASGLGIAAVNGVPDANILTLTEVCDAVALIARTSSLPVIADGDTGYGHVRSLRRLVQELERAGVAAVCIEDKLYPKRNSLLDGQELIDPCEFAMKLRLAKTTQRDPDFVVLARIESLVAGESGEQALERARIYADAGADALVIHSKAREPAEILDFARAWRDAGQPIPLVAIPTTYNAVTVGDLDEAGIAAVIYANQGLRAAVHAMERAFTEILASGSSESVEGSLVPVLRLFELTGEAEIDRNDTWFAEGLEHIRRARLVRAAASHDSALAGPGS
jgi:phosphoenolpyruvate phosphomutase